MLGQLDRSIWTGKPDKDREERLRHDSNNRTASGSGGLWSRWLGQNSQNRTAETGLPGQDSLNMTAET
jgi:hypothetical protein